MRDLHTTQQKKGTILFQSIPSTHLNNNNSQKKKKEAKLSLKYQKIKEIDT